MKELEALLRVAAKHPWYCQLKTGTKIEDWPLLEKKALYEKLAATHLESKGGIYYSRSGGTSSTRPFFFPTGVKENHLQRAKFAKNLSKAGILSSESIALNIFPIIRMYRSMEIFNEFSERCGATVLPMAALASDQELYELAQQFGANTLMGMPSRLIAFARYLQENKLTCKFPRVIFGGEFMQTGKKKLLEDVLGVEVFSGIYGSAELGIVGWNADVKDAPTYTFSKAILHVEILNPDKDGFGAIVATNKLRKQFPIIRYNTGDVGKIIKTEEQGSLIELKGRQGDSFLIGDNYHSVSDFSDIFKEFVEFQIRIYFDEKLNKDTIQFFLVPSTAITDAKKKWAIDQIHETLQGHEVMYRTMVGFVGSEQLKKLPGNSKTPAVIDERGR